MVKNILLGGTMRSGTTLMSAILDSHPDITIIPDIIKWFWTKVYLEYNNISTQYELDTILYEMAPYIYHGLREDQIARFTNGEVRKKIISRGISYHSIFNTLVEIYNSQGEVKDIVGTKATHVSNIYSKYVEQFKRPLVIHMMRDCRDVYFSHKKRVAKLRQQPLNKFKTVIVKSKDFIYNKVFHTRSSGLFNRKSFLFTFPEKIMDDWVFTNINALETKKKYPENILILKYEDFVTDPEHYIKIVYNKIGITFRSGDFDYSSLKDRDGKKFQANTSHKVEVHIANVNISDKNIYHSHSKLNEKENHYYKKYIADAASSLGY